MAQTAPRRIPRHAAVFIKNAMVFSSGATNLASDPAAQYCEVIEIDASQIRPMIALPVTLERAAHRRAAAAGEGRDRLRRVMHGGQERGHGHVRRVLTEAVDRGEKVAPWVRSSFNAAHRM